MRKRTLSLFVTLAVVLSMVVTMALATDGQTSGLTTQVNKEVLYDASAGQGISASQYDGNTWVTNADALTTDGSGVTTFTDTADNLYESFSTTFNGAESWEGDVVISTEFYLDPAALEVGQGFSAIVDILPSWRAYVANVVKTDDTTIQIGFSNNTDNYYVIGSDSRATYSVTEAGWYTFQWKLTDENGQVACTLYVNDTKVDTLTNADDVASDSYVRKFYVQSYAPQSGTDKETCPGGTIAFRNTQKYVEHFTYTVSDSQQLLTAVAQAKSGDTIVLAGGEYDVTTTGTNGQQGTGLILDQNDITLKAADPANKPVLYGFSTAANAGIVGGVNGQDTIYVSGQNVTLQDLKIMPLGGTGTNTADWQKTVEVVAGASGFTMTGCETLPNTKGENTMSNAAGLIHISTNDASVSGNSFGTGTTVCSGWSGSNGSVPTGFYTVNASGNTWSDADIASHTDGIVVVDDSVYVNHEVALQQVIDDESLAGKTVVLAADLTLTDGIQITRPLTLDGNNHTVTCQGISTSVPAINGETMDYSAIIAATADATIQNLIVKGDPIEISKDSNLTHSTRYIGVAAIDANVTLEGCSIDSVTYNGDLQGMQNGFGVYAVSTSDKTLTMKDTTVTNFNKTGIVARDNIHVDMDGCNVIGFGPQAVIAQNGIQLEGSAVIQNSTFQDMSYTADNEWKYASTAIYSMGDAEDEVILDNVNCTNVDWSVTAYGGDVEIRSGVYECSPGCEAVWADEGVSMVVLGGTFATSPEDYLLKDSIVTEENGEYVVHTHTYGEEWKSDETNHWHECGACGAKADVAEHSFVWVTDKEATATEAGSKHQECSVCGYKLAAVEIPATGDNTGNTGDNTGNTGDNSATSGSNTNTNTNSSTSNAPKTGDTVNPMLWIALLAASTASLAGVIVYNKKRNTTR